MNKKFYFILILIQILAIVSLGFIIYKRKQILGITSINPVNKDSIIYTSKTLKYFYEPKPNTIEELNPWVPYMATYTINSDGLNERRNYNIEKPEGIYRILTLGDSFTYGLYVDTPYNWTEQLEDKLNAECNQPYEVINLGVAGYDIQYSVERFKLRGIKYNPDLIIWFLKNDDTIQINEYIRGSEEYYRKKMMASGEMDRAVARGNFYPSWNMALKEYKEKYDPKDIEKAQMQYFEDFKSIYEGKLIISTFSNEPKSVTTFLNKAFTFDNKKTFLQYLTSMHINPSYYFPNDGHPTVKGHSVITTDIFNYLKVNNLTSCP